MADRSNRELSIRHSTGAGVISKSTIVRGKEKGRRRRRILTEDDYLTRLGAILKRDYFPNLPRLEAQYEYLDALERDDYVSLRFAADRLAQMEATREGGESLVEAPQMSLDEFQATFVTEDTAEFEELMEKVNKIKRKKFIEFHGRLPQVADDPSRRLLLAPSQSEHPRPKGRVNAENVVLAASPRADPRLPLGMTPEDIKYEYWKMVAEYGSGGQVACNFDDDRSLAGVSTVSSVDGTGVAQMGGIDAAKYDFIDTPAYDRFTPAEEAAVGNATPARSAISVTSVSSVQTTASKRRMLLQSPAVQRLLKHRQIKGTVSTVFDVPKQKSTYGNCKRHHESTNRINK